MDSRVEWRLHVHLGKKQGSTSKAHEMQSGASSYNISLHRYESQFRDEGMIEKKVAASETVLKSGNQGGQSRASQEALSKT
jgi:hypothetical protein